MELDRKDFFKYNVHKLQRNKRYGWTKTDTASLLNEGKSNVTQDINLAKAILEHPELKKCNTKGEALQLYKLIGEGISEDLNDLIGDNYFKDESQLHKFFKDNPEQAHKCISKKKRIAALIRNLERTQGINVLDWCWLLEWHKNGFPHWHLFLLVDKQGRSGQIGFRKVLPYWEFGRCERRRENDALAAA